MIDIKIYIASDHNGTDKLKEVKKYLEENGFEAIVSKQENTPEDDYPDFAYETCKNVIDNDGLGILICGTGIGMSIAANKIKGIRCARVVNSDDAFTAKNHNGANVIAFANNLENEEMFNIIDNFLMTKEPSEERHLRRVEKVKELENATYLY